jgi:hypothetical protein
LLAEFRRLADAALADPGYRPYLPPVPACCRPGTRQYTNRLEALTTARGPAWRRRCAWCREEWASRWVTVPEPWWRRHLHDVRRGYVALCSICAAGW